MKHILTTLFIAFFIEVTYAQNGSEIFTSSGVFTVPDGITSITIEVVGAGGTGGGNGGGGGGGGGYAKGAYTVTPGNTIEVSVGVGSSGSVAGTTSAGNLISASGGENGFSVPNPNLGGGGAGGVGTNGNIANSTGGTGGGGYWTYFGGGGGGAAGASGDGSIGGNTIVWNGNNCLTPGGAAGISGGAPGGDGGKGAGFTDNFCNVTDPAGAGVNFGGGGGGGNGNGGVPGPGANGYCIITWGFGTGMNVTLNNTAMNFPTVFSNSIKILNTNGTGNEEYELTNSFGQLIWSGKNVEQQNFSGIANGWYFLNVRDQYVMQTFKLLKH